MRAVTALLRRDKMKRTVKVTITGEYEVNTKDINIYGIEKEDKTDEQILDEMIEFDKNEDLEIFIRYLENITVDFEKMKVRT